jgi:integrase
VPVGAVAHSDVQAWVSTMTLESGATTVIRNYGVLASILDTAVKDRRLNSNPARGIKLPRKPKRKHRYLNHAQVQLLADCTDQHPTLILVLAYTGIRWGEATAGRLHSLETLRRRLSVDENAVEIGAKIIVGTPKTHEVRSVPYPQFLSEPLAKLCEGKKRGQLVFGEGDTWVRRPNSQNGWFARAVRAAQAIDPDFPTMTPHDLRHTAASLAVSAGANVKAVQKMLGHASAAMTLDTYADLFDDDLDAVGVALDKARNDSIVGSTWASA